MRTDHDQSDRLKAAQRGMRLRARAAKDASHAALDEREAAALRGKACAYRESADMLEAVIRGGYIHRKFDLGAFCKVK